MAGSQAEAREVIIDGKRLETLGYAREDAKAALVLLHEGLGSVSLWRDFPEQLAQRTGCSVLVYSRYGHGKSQRLTEPRSPDFMHHEAEVVLPQLLECFGVQRPILVGHSDGGSIALIYAGRWPERVRGLVLEAPHVFVEDVCIASITKIGELYKAGELAKRLRRFHDHPGEMFWGWHDIWLNAEFRGWNIEPCLGAITCPTLVIQGEQDEYGTLAQVAAVRKRLPAAESLILRNCGHSPHRDQPAATLERITQFVAGILGEAGRKT